MTNRIFWRILRKWDGAFYNTSIIGPQWTKEKKPKTEYTTLEEAQTDACSLRACGRQVKVKIVRVLLVEGLEHWTDEYSNLLEIEFPSHDLEPGGYDAYWQDRKCPRCHKTVSTVRSSEFGQEKDGWHAGSYKRGPVGVCRSKPPTLYAVLAPDGRVSCSTLIENAHAKMVEWPGSYLLEYEASNIVEKP